MIYVVNATLDLNFGLGDALKCALGDTNAPFWAVRQE